jgi:hypothetical protein
MAWMSVVQADRPLFNRQPYRCASRRIRATAERVLTMAAVNVGASIGRVLQNLQHAGTVRRHPNDGVRRRPP